MNNVAHLYFGEIESTPEESTVVQRAPAPHRDQQFSNLEGRLDTLEKALTRLAEQLGEEIDLGD